MSFPPSAGGNTGIFNIPNASPIPIGPSSGFGGGFGGGGGTPSSSSATGAVTKQYDPFSHLFIDTPAPVNRVVGISSGGGTSAGGGAPSGGGTPAPSIGPTYGDPANFSVAAKQQAEDYDSIMGNLSSLMKGYTQSPDVTSSLGTLKDLSTTGGYSPQDIQDLRARAISPIRSIYSTAQQNLDRSRALGGGYSPNAAAATAQMARDEASQIGGAETNVNAGIAQNVAQNKLSIAPSYASAAQGAQGQNYSIPLSINNLMASLYGTTPALTSLFGQQTATATGLGQNQQQINQNAQNNALRTLLALLQSGGGI